MSTWLIACRNKKSKVSDYYISQAQNLTLSLSHDCSISISAFLTAALSVHSPYSNIPSFKIP